MKEEYETIDLRELFLLVKKNILMILAVTIASAAVGFLISAFLLSPQYEASATLIVNSREDQTAQTTITNDQITSATKLVDTYSVILTSDTVLDKAIADLELTLDYEELLDKVTVESVNGTQVMKISVQDEDPVLAQSIVANIVEQAPEIIIQTVKAGSVEVISQAKTAEEPVSPKKVLNTALAGILGLVLSLGFVLLRNVMNNKFMTDDDISKKLGLTVLGVIPQIDIKG
ncbi:YveK family protein [Ruthenibacterium lactatiformans]|uniref:YveK family protein n=1 Tax=Ruthenibacterium lactatiformans TaxID=1550024 RepID=UPI0026720D93|nr:Wzz/FepE/Etk N-terminal domain-containing protein [Ruthenibacterium lactatiformans]